MGALKVTEGYEHTEMPEKEPEFRVCGKCTASRPSEEFPGAKPTGRPYCVGCSQEGLKRREKKHAQARRKRIRRAKERITDRLGGSCRCCGETEVAFLTLERSYEPDDPIYPDRERNIRTDHLWVALLRAKYPNDRYALFCQNCKTARDQEGFCPHEFQHA